MHRDLVFFAAVSLSCGGPTKTVEIAEAPAKPTKAPPKLSLAEKLSQAKDKHKHLLVFWGETGVWVETLSGESLFYLTGSPSAYPSLKKDELFYMEPDRAEVRHVDLRTGDDVLIAKLPKLSNPCFDEENPISYIENYGASWNHSIGELCFSIGDRNYNMASINMEFRVGLESGKVDSSYQLLFDECKTPNAVEGDGVCKDIAASDPVARGTVAPEALAKGVARLVQREGKLHEGFGEMLLESRVSPSGKWIQFSDFEASGDYIYSGLLFFNVEEGRVYALSRESESLISLDYVALTQHENSHEPPDDICLLPGESRNFWSAGQDLFVLDNCVTGGIGVLDMNKDTPARAVDARGARVY